MRARSSSVGVLTAMVHPSLLCAVACPRVTLSLPELLSGETGTLRQGGKLQPRHAGVGVVKPHGRGGKPTVGSGDDVLAPNNLGKAHDLFGDELRVLH